MFPNGTIKHQINVALFAFLYNIFAVNIKESFYVLMLRVLWVETTILKKYISYSIYHTKQSPSMLQNKDNMS